LRHWFCITNPWNWFIVESTKTWGVDDRYLITLQRIQLEDKLVFYATNMPPNLARTVREKIDATKWKTLDEKISQVEKTIVWIYTVVGTYYKDESDLGWLDRDGSKPSGNFPHRIKITSIYSKPFKPMPLDINRGKKLLDELLLFPDKSKSYYNMLYPSMLVMLEEDYQTIKRYADTPEP
jgi:predicted RNA-binding protein